MKHLITVIFLFLTIPQTFAQVDFLVKKTTSGTETYSTTLTDISKNSSLTFQIFSTGGTTQKSFQVSFPTGWNYNNNYHTTGTTCDTINITTKTNSNFIYNFSGNDNCLSIVTFSYTPTNATPGNNQINIIHNSNNISQVNVGITANNTLLKALSKDQNNNGFIDGYEIHFSSAITNTGAINGLTVGGQNVESYVGNTFSGIINFADNIFNTGELPQITSNGITFLKVGIIGNTSIIEEDTAKPILLKINNQNISGSNNINIGTGNIVFDFSEKLHPTSTGAFSIKKDGNDIAGNFTLSDEKLTFTPNSSLSAGNYILTSTIEARDWSNNGNSLEQLIITLVVNDITAPTGLSLGDGIGIMINNGSVNTTNRYVQLNLLATDDIGVEKMWISNNSDFSSGNWENYATTKNNWLLTTGNGEKTIYVKFRDVTGNISPTYYKNIEYKQSLSYLSFYEIDNIYTNNSTITLSGGCNYVDNFGVLISSVINFTVNNTFPVGTITCDNGNKNWSNTFNLQTNQTNNIKIWYGTNYNDATIKNSVNIINPIPTCQTVSNGVITGNYPTCEFSCNVGYRKVGNSCIDDTKTFSCASKPANSSWNSVSSYTQTWNGSNWLPVDSNTTYNINLSNTECRFKCNNGYNWNGTSCVLAIVNPPSQGGGGGGGGSITKTCTDSDLVCSLHNGSYIWLRKSGVVCDGGNLAKTCSISQTGTGSENIETSSGNIIDDNGGTTKEILKLDEIKNYLSLNVNKGLHKLVNQLYTMINYEFINYFVLVNNNTSNNYQELLLNYKELFININNYLSLKNKNYLLNARENYINFNKYYNITKNLENKYITKVTKNGDTIFETKVEKLKIPLNKIEKIIIGKYKNLLSSYTITKTEYNDAIKNYNNFVLYLSIYRIDKTSEAKKRGKEYLTLVIKTYNIKIKKDIVINTIKEDSKTLVKDIYNFSKDLKFGDYNDDVRNLQLLLKHYNYFPFEATGYFGSGTKEYLEKFCYEVLGIKFMGILNLEIREKILNLEY